MKTFLTVLFLTFALFLNIAHCYEDPLENRVRQFVPEGYTILDIIPGDLNRDKINDIVLILAPEKEDAVLETVDDPINNPKTKRPLLLLIGQKDGGLKLAAKNNNAVYCFKCGGIFGDPYTKTVIKNGFFTIEHYGGSAWRWSRLITFKYSEVDKNWYLHRDGGESFHVNEPNKVKKTMKTSKDFGKVRFDQFDIYKE